MISLGAALFFVVILAWQQPVLIGDRIPQLGFVAVVAWVLISLCWFWNRIRRENAQQKDGCAVTGLEYYRKSLERRRDHLRNAWLWHGPLFLSCAIFIVDVEEGFCLPQSRKSIASRASPRSLDGFGILRRRRQANEIQREIDEIDPC